MNRENRFCIIQLIAPRCKCCSGQGALCFSSCPSCGHIVLICDEVGTTFPDPRNLEDVVYGAIDEPNCNCPNCAKVHFCDFINSSGEEIQALGYKVSEYE